MSTTDSTTETTRKSSQSRSKPQRALACVICQQRKVKCDRQFPCANCVKSRAQCVPATQVARRRRRFPERELLERLRHYEGLLRHHNIKFEPMHVDAKGTPSPYIPPTMASNDGPSTSEVLKGQVLHTDHGSDSSDDGRAQKSIVKKAWKQFIHNDDHLVFGSRNTALNISTLHPDPVQIIRMWQLYLDTINPLLKVTHTPSLQGRVIEAASNVSKINPPLEALMFGIYCISLSSLTAKECKTMFGSTKEDLLTKYQYACQQALWNCGFLRSSDRDSLTALYLYMISVRPSTVPQSLASLLGLAVRIAQRMGLHSESILAKHTVFEAEMRRRLWWSLVLFDTRISEMADFRTTTLTSTWDCRPPLNVNDSDLRPEMKEPPQAQAQFPTEAIFAVVRSELGDFLRRTRFHMALTSPWLKELFASGAARGHIPEGKELVVLETMLETKYLVSCDPENPVHYMAIWMSRAQLAKCHLLEQRFGISASSARTEAQRLASLSYALEMLKCDTKLVSSPLTVGFRWLLHPYYPFSAYVHVVQYLKRQPLSDQAEQAWEIMSSNHEAHFHSSSGGALHLQIFAQIFAQTIVQAWDARKLAFQNIRKQSTMVVPGIVSSVLQRMPQPAPGEQMAGTGQEKQPSVATDMSFGDWPTSAPVGMEGLEGYPAAEMAAYPFDFAQMQPDLDTSSFDWSAMDSFNWDLVNAPASDTLYHL